MAVKTERENYLFGVVAAVVDINLLIYGEIMKRYHTLQWSTASSKSVKV